MLLCYLLVLLVCAACVAASPSKLLKELGSKYTLTHVHSNHFDRVEWGVSKSGAHVLKHPTLTSLVVNNVEVTLEKNEQLFAPRYTQERHVYSRGYRVQELETPALTADDVEHCHYTGYTAGSEHTKVAMSACNGGFSGIIHLDGVAHVLKPALHVMSMEEVNEHVDRLAEHEAMSCINGCTGVSRSTVHVMYKADDYFSLQEHRSASCGVSHAEEIDQVTHHGHRTNNNAHEHNEEETVHFLQGFGLAPATTGKSDKIELQACAGCEQYVELLVVNDKSRYDTSGGEPELSSAEIVNMANTYYANTFGELVKIMIVGQVTFTVEDPWNNTVASSNPDEVDHAVLLQTFHEWRSTPGQTVLHDNGHLFTSHDFEGATVGYAGVQSMCYESSSGGINECTRTEAFNAAIFAHELGHNFGFLHDSPDVMPELACPASGYIMNSIIGIDPPSEFSLCSEDYYSTWESLGRTCLDNYPDAVYTVGEPVCQNGIWETGEECDCGSPDCSGIDDCCDGETCMLVDGAACSSFSTCCTDQCEFEAAGVTCRDENSDCDIVEVCTGDSGSCPQDRFKGSGASCSTDEDGSGSCYLGYCMSYNYDCRIKGSLYPHTPYVDCADSSSTAYNADPCGALYCDTYYGECVTFETTDGNGDPTLLTVSNGVPCGDGNQCLDEVCVPSALMNIYFQWFTHAWTDCYDCDEAVTRTVRCKELGIDGKFTQVDELYCSFPDRPDSTGLCDIPVGSDEVCVHSATDNEADKIAREILEKYGAADTAHTLRDMIPRTCGEDDFDVNSASYQNCITLLAIPGIIGSAFALFLMMFYYCCPTKLECCYGCDHEETRKEHIKREKANALKLAKNPDAKISEPHFHEGRLGPFFTIIFLFCVLISFGGVGYFYNGEVRRGFRGEDEGAAHIALLMMTEADVLAQTLEIRLNNILSEQTMMDTMVPEMASYIPFLKKGTANFSRELTDFGDEVNSLSLITPGQGDAQYTAPDINLTCDRCEAAPGEMATIAADLETTSEASFVELEDAVTNAEAFMGEFRYLLEEGGQIQWAYQQSLDMQEYVDENRATLVDYTIYLTDMDEIRWTFTIIFFGLPFVCFLLVFTGFACKKVACLKINITVSLLMVLCSWLMFTFHLPTAILLSDTCGYMGSAEADPMTYLNLTETSADIFFACLANTSLVGAMDLGDSLAFADHVYFPEPADVDEMLDLTDLYAYQTDQDATTVGDLADETVVPNLFSALNSFTTPDTFDENNINTCDPTAYGADEANVRQFKWNIITGLDSLALANSTLVRISGNVSDIVTSSETLKTDVETVILGFDQMGTDLAPLISNAEAFVDDSYCGGIGDNYLLFKSALCTTETTAFSYLALAFFMIGVFQPLNIWVNIVMIKRIHHEQDEKAKAKAGFHSPISGSGRHTPSTDSKHGHKPSMINIHRSQTPSQNRRPLPADQRRAHGHQSAQLPRRQINQPNAQHGTRPSVQNNQMPSRGGSRSHQMPNRQIPQRGMPQRQRPSVRAQSALTSPQSQARKATEEEMLEYGNTNVIEMGNIRITYDETHQYARCFATCN